MNDLYQHFRKDEQPFVDQVLEWKHQVETQYAYKLTDFLDPREQDIIQSIVGQASEVKVDFWGGHEYAERKRAILFPDYYKPECNDYQLVVYELLYPVKFVSINHRNVLGTLMSIGLKRSKFGDIFIEGDRIQLVVAKEIAEYVKMNLTTVGKAKVKLKQVSMSEVIDITETWDSSRMGTVSSLRLDVILAEAHHFSRQKILQYVKNGLAKVNWKVIDNPAYECRNGDILSVRGLGRCKVMSIEGKTKKEKWRILFGFQK